MQESLIEGNAACKSICMNTLHYQDSPVSFMMSVTLIDKTDPSFPTKREDYLLIPKHPWDLTLILIILSEHILWYFHILQLDLDGFALGLRILD